MDNWDFPKTVQSTITDTMRGAAASGGPAFRALVVAPEVVVEPFVVLLSAGGERFAVLFSGKGDRILQVSKLPEDL